jgi:hypothetical protein
LNGGRSESLAIPFEKVVVPIVSLLNVGQNSKSIVVISESHSFDEEVQKGLRPVEV